MKYTQSYMTDLKNNRIFQQCWLPDQEIKAVILLVHGLGEHSSRYSNLLDCLLPQNYAVYSWDHIGHGRSDGDRKFITHFSDFTQVITQYLTEIKQQHPDLPLYLFGHSMGGLIATHYLIDHQQEFAGTILSAPALKVIGGVPPLKRYGGKLMSAIFPKYGMSSIQGQYISRDPLVVELANNDPLVEKGKTSVRLLAELVDAMARVNKEAHHIRLPMLILQGTDDLIVDPAGADRLYQLISSEDKTLKIYNGLYHELINEPEKDEVLADITEWLNKQQNSEI